MTDVLVPMYPPPSLAEFRLEAERRYFQALLELREKHDWSMAQLAAISGLRRENVWHKLREIGLTGEEPSKALRLRWGCRAKHAVCWL